MAQYNLDTSRFTFEEGYRKDDRMDMMQINLDNSADQVLWQLMIRDTPLSEVSKWLHDILLPDPAEKNEFAKTWVIRTIDTQKVIAFATLCWPNEEAQNPVERTDKMDRILESAPGTVDKEYWKVFLGGQMMDPTRFGYDSRKHFRRQGMMVHKDFQRLGLGTVITKHCNDIADAYDNGNGRSTFAFVRAAATKVFESCGFEQVGVASFDMSEYGGPKDWSIQCMRRDPAGSEAI